MAKAKTYVYKNNGAEQKIEGVGLVRKGETIAVPHEELDHSDLELIETIEKSDDDPEE